MYCHSLPNYSLPKFETLSLCKSQVCSLLRRHLNSKPSLCRRLCNSPTCSSSSVHLRVSYFSLSPKDCTLSIEILGSLCVLHRFVSPGYSRIL
ncbi:hypothetical protein Syun_003755 [Stephania yunnanensis]|uniref:Uncharacterized protein n=1 Tax=Stephania yunnanensis TaxID=152371 RepID=A0AAP0L1R1_9MAGN